MSHSILRIKNSGYFEDDFNNRESSALKSIDRINEYYLGETNSKDRLIVLSNTDFDMSCLDNYLSQIDLIVHPNSGYNNFTSEFTRAANFPIIIGHELRKYAVTQYILTQLLKEFSYENQTKWERLDIVKDKTLLKDQSVLIIGKGHIGLELESQLKHLVHSINWYDPYKGHTKYSNLSTYDIIIMSCSVNNKNVNMIDQDFLEECKENVIIVNPARGALVDLSAMMKKCEQGATYIVDVYPKEPFDLSTLDHPRIKTTSHIAGCYSLLAENIIKFEQKVITDFFKDSRLTSYEDSSLINKIIDGEFI